MEYIIDSIDKETGTFSLLTIDEKGYNHRRAYAPGDDLSDLPIDIQNGASALWTPEIMGYWQKIKEQQAAEQQAMEDAYNALPQLPTIQEQVNDLSTALDILLGTEV